jgi:polysaccharide biosynthesis/export protein
MKGRSLLRSVSALATVLTTLVGVNMLAGQSLKPETTKKPEVTKHNAGTPAQPIPAPTVASDNTATQSDGKSEEQAILPYYENYLKEYRLGPSDVISVEVFGQCPDYCISAKPIPPNARISYPLIREGVLVAGRTVEQVAAEITKKLDEFIIDPKVTVTLEKAQATRYSVMGNVAAPGVKVMDKKVSVYEAILEAGGVTKNGDKKKVAVVSYTKDGKLSRKMVSLADMEAGKAPMVYLSPGDQVFVSGKGFSIDKVFEILGRASTARYMVGSPF